MRADKMAIVFLGLSLFTASSGITSAYLADYPQFQQNVVTSGSVHVKLTEPEWSPEKAKDLAPGNVVPKNPIATNTGKNDAWIFLSFSIPVRHIALVDPASRRKMAPADTELFSFTAGDEWELIERTPKGGAVDYVYGYRQIVKPQESTAPVFAEVKLVNYLEGELTAKDVLQIPVRAIAVQDHVRPEGTDLAEIYRVYLNGK